MSSCTSHSRTSKLRFAPSRDSWGGYDGTTATVPHGQAGYLTLTLAAVMRDQRVATRTQATGPPFFRRGHTRPPNETWQAAHNRRIRTYPTCRLENRATWA